MTTRSQRRNRRRRKARRRERALEAARRARTCVVCLEPVGAYPKSYDCPRCAKPVCAPCVIKMQQLRGPDTFVGFPCAVCRNWVDLSDGDSLNAGGSTPLKPLMTEGCPQNFVVFDCCKQEGCTRRVLLHHHKCADGCYRCKYATITMVHLP